MAEISTTDLTTLQSLMQGVQNVVDAPMAFERGDPDKTRIREIQALAGMILRGELTAGNGDRLLQLLQQLTLLFEGIAGVGTRVSLKPAARLVDHAVGVLRNSTDS
jgi:hypothetical protein